jgi:hypothetical protein
MSPIHISFAKMLVKMFHMSLKYIHLLHVSTSLGHPQVIFFFKEPNVLHTLSLVLLSMPLYIYFWCYMVPPLPVAFALCTIGYAASLSCSCCVGSLFSVPLWTILMWILETQDGMLWAGSIWLRIATSGGLL